MNALSFSLSEVLSLIGVAQCVYLAVHIAFRFGRIRRAGLPFLYFFLLGLAFLADFGAGRLSASGMDAYFYLQWVFWYSGPPLSALLVFHLADMTRKPGPGEGWVLLLLPFGAVLSALAAAKTGEGCAFLQPCQPFLELLDVTGLMAGAICLLVIFSRRALLEDLPKQKFGRIRYWLIFSIVVLNTLFLAAMLAGAAGRLDAQDVLMIRNVLGLGFVYLVSAGFLSIFPYEPKSVPQQQTGPESLTAEELALARRIEELLDLQKVYQEPTYSRADLARECAVPESVISRVINAHFLKSFPQIINERRVEDAKRLLLETDAPVQVICSEVGFNSLPSFNRVFRDLTGDSPGQFRKKTPNLSS